MRRSSRSRFVRIYRKLFRMTPPSYPRPRKTTLRLLSPVPVPPVSSPPRSLGWDFILMRAANSLRTLALGRSAPPPLLPRPTDSWTRVTIHVDGSFHPHGGRMGWGAVICQRSPGDDAVLGILSGGTQGGHALLAEANAMVTALESLPSTTQDVVIFSDCQRLVNDLTWALSLAPSRNRLDQLGLKACVTNRIHAATLGRRVEFRWERGHNGNLFNEAADILAGYGTGEHIPSHPPHHAHLVRARAADLARRIHTGPASS